MGSGNYVAGEFLKNHIPFHVPATGNRFSDSSRDSRSSRAKSWYYRRFVKIKGSFTRGEDVRMSVTKGYHRLPLL